ncbi:hypothetical protein [Tenacibaculum jejuense]|uniref:Probable lipoprotein n=1 Tax=Tenacibaculum jejuense TaxID=584609 RepID=A0A238UEF2_9FLAO|nr:hypothetical protein [Tenacibaculum jejuense]SNR16854.1 Probable lipoprotein precursor [Tenacibaculum jejuense]
MKKLCFLALALCVSVYFTSCSSDSSPTAGNEEVAEQQNALEDNKTPVSTIENGIVISGATKESGTPPAPNSDLDFQINSDLKTGFQGSGFDIKFTSTDNVAGAYVQFKDSEGNPTNTFFDIPASSFSSRMVDGTSNFKSIFKKSDHRISSRMQEETTINVDLQNSVPAGEFCYDICIYDSNNNISRIETVCVTIEAWGGNASIVGEWVPEDDEDADVEMVICDNGSSVSVDFDALTQSLGYISFNQDGSFFESLKGEYATLDYSSTKETCTPVFDEVVKEEYRADGNWAYNEDDNSLTVVFFSFTDFIDGGNSETYNFGNVAIDGLFVKEVTSDRLVLEFGDDFIGTIELVLKRR